MARPLKWSCIEQCGACCKLSPESRTEAMEVLNNEEQELYLSLVGIDGWCKFYDKARRKCTVYKTRPSFCDVKNLCTTFKISESNTESFAIKCCKEQIKHIHGARSREMKRFISNIKQVK